MVRRSINKRTLDYERAILSILANIDQADHAEIARGFKVKTGLASYMREQGMIRVIGKDGVRNIYEAMIKPQDLTRDDVREVMGIADSLTSGQTRNAISKRDSDMVGDLFAELEPEIDELEHYETAELVKELEKRGYSINKAQG